MCQYSSGVCTMEVQSAQVSDTGTYTCIAVNELGTEETSSYVVVEGMNKAQSTSKISDSISQTVKLSLFAIVF